MAVTLNFIHFLTVYLKMARSHDPLLLVNLRPWWVIYLHACISIGLVPLSTQLSHTLQLLLSDIESYPKFSPLELESFLLLHLISSFQTQGPSPCAQVPWTWDFPPLSAASLAMEYILFGSWGIGSYSLTCGSVPMACHLLSALLILSAHFPGTPLDTGQAKPTPTLLTPLRNWWPPGLYSIVWTHSSVFLPLTELMFRSLI